MFQSIIVFLGTKVASTQTFSVVLGLISVHIGYVRSVWLGLAVGGVTIALSATLTYLKHSFQVARPEEPLIPITGYAFPSAHAGGIVFLSLMLYPYLFSILKIDAAYKPWVFSALFVVSALICYSRIYFNVHTPLQVAAGASVGFMFGIIAYYILTHTGA